MISLLVVNYRSASLAEEAIRSARATTRELHVVVVDNSCDAAEAGLLRSTADVLHVSPTNLGYAAAINVGRKSCKGDVVVVSNPDVVFFPGAIETLAATIASSKWAVAGPALYWDQAQQWILPPSDLQTLTGKADEVLASRFRRWSASRDRRRFRRRMAFWSARKPTTVAAISGAVMAIALRDFDAVGGFDERFRLYFEENDFLRRIARAGRRIAYVPEARVRHLYNQSAGGEQERTAALYAESELRYFTKWYGRRTARVLKALERPPRYFSEYPPCAGSFALPRSGLIVEASPLPSFGTAAGHFAGSAAVDLPPEVWGSYKGEVLYLRAVDPSTGDLVAACARYRS